MPEDTNRTCVVIGARQPGPMIIPEGAFVMVCDGGYAHLGDIRPDLIIGDFDSLGYVPEAACPVVRLPAEKDDTDIMAALRKGLELGFRSFILYGCMGGRPDHAYANFQVLGWLTAHGARGELRGDGWIITHIENTSISFTGRPGAFFSVFAPEGDAQGVTIENAKYALDRYTLSGAFPIGVSNEFVNEAPVTLSVENGRLLIMREA
ncbi:MAG: thiamine diphosphokinase [Clostridia bacterium]|nr:thiamine diphosphokinase [Clostridia bacterium]